MRHPHLADIAVSTLLVAFVSLFAVGLVDFSIGPHEDAAILMRYAEHFARGHGIVWNLGERPVDGATDFLLVVVLGLLLKTGLPLGFATRSLGFASHVLLILLVYWTLRRGFRAGLVPSLVSSVYLAVGPGLYYVAAYYGTPLFALFAGITWCIALNLITRSGDSHRLSLLFAASGLLMGLTRPEGVILAGLMAASVICARGFEPSRLTILYFVGVFALVGGPYFFWRWHYFGYPLPNPFYVKGGGALRLDGLKSSILYTVQTCFPFVAAFALGLRSPGGARRVMSFSIPIAGFALVFVLLSGEMNFGGRFQYALLPIVLLSWYPLVKGVGDEFNFPKWKTLDSYRRATVVLFLAAISCGATFYQYRLASRHTYFHDGRYELAHMLGEYTDRGYVLATTEAGLLPLYSGWRTVDAWGLNDPWIAHHGRVTPEYLDRYKPHVIMIHGWSSPVAPSLPHARGRWLEMVHTMTDYAEKNGYVLAAAFGDTPYDTHQYYVRNDFADGAEIIEKIRSIEYRWYLTGRLAVNFFLWNT